MIKQIIFTALLFSSQVHAERTYEDVMNQPPVVIAGKECTGVVNDRAKFSKCISPILITADCRYRVSLRLKDTQFTTEEEKKERFMNLFNQCYKKPSEFNIKE